MFSASPFCFVRGERGGGRRERTVVLIRRTGKGERKKRAVGDVLYTSNFVTTVIYRRVQDVFFYYWKF